MNILILTGKFGILGLLVMAVLMAVTGVVLFYGAAVILLFTAGMLIVMFLPQFSRHICGGAQL